MGDTRTQRHTGAEEAIDAMAASSPEQVQQMLCCRFSMCTSRREVETFRQKRFRAAGGRQTFIAAMTLGGVASEA